MAASSRSTNGAGNTKTEGGASTQTQTQAVLHLRGVVRVPSEGGEGEESAEGSGEGNGRKIKWAEGTVDNEGLGRKKSKVCCIYHAPRGIDESSDESSSDSDDSDSGDDARSGSARPAKNSTGKGKKGSGHEGHDHGKGKRSRSPNAYEKQPKVKGEMGKRKG